MEKSVKEFLIETSDLVSNYWRDMFYENTKCEFEDLNIESPIEQLLYCALKALREINGISDSDLVEINGKQYILGLAINPQYKIGKYRVDFLITKYGLNENRIQKSRSLVVECDSQIFHERSENERRYEKARDRYLQEQGYNIYHYTGKEIIEKTYEIAKEIIENVCCYEIDFIG